MTDRMGRLEVARCDVGNVVDCDVVTFVDCSMFSRAVTTSSLVGSVDRIVVPQPHLFGPLD